MSVSTQTVTIPAGQSLSAPVNCTTGTPVRVRMPAAWTGGDRGIITFQISTDNVTYMDYFQADGQEVSAVVMLGATTRVDHTVGGKGATWIKIRTGTREAPVVQKNAVDFIVVLES